MFCCGMIGGFSDFIPRQELNASNANTTSSKLDSLDLISNWISFKFFVCLTFRFSPDRSPLYFPHRDLPIVFAPQCGQILDPPTQYR